MVTDMREMKDSGIYDIDYIPKEWIVKPLKYVCNMQSGDNLTSQEIEEDDEFPVYGGNGIRGFYRKYNTKGKHVLIGRQGALCGNIHVVDGWFWATDHAVVVDNDITVETRYLGFLLQTMNLNQYSVTTAQPGLSVDKIINLRGCFPLFSEQQAIADFLDSKCAEIDALSADIQSEIDTLEAYKRSVITEAVTKGLDRNVPVKDSGIEWVGEIPESWEIVNIKRIYDRSHRYPLGDGDHGMIKPTDYVEEGVPYIRVQNLGFCTDLKIDNIVYISAEKNNRIKSSTLRPNDVLFAKTGATIGKTGIVPETMPIANTTSHVGKITVSKEYNPRYIYYVLSSYIGYKQFWDIASLKSTRPELSIEETKRLLFTVPKSEDIQDKIVDYLDNACKEIDLVIAQKREQLTVLAEYKKSIIYEYITGKKEVPVT